MPTKFVRLFCWVLACGLLVPIHARSQESASIESVQEIRRVLSEQAKAWNEGSIDRFMDGYARIPSLRFASGGTITYGWQETLDRYRQRYPDREKMGALSFSDLNTTILAPDAAVVFGRWRLKTSQGEPNGLFTLLLRKTEVGWRIVADHTSAATP